MATEKLGLILEFYELARGASIRKGGKENGIKLFSLDSSSIVVENKVQMSVELRRHMEFI